MASSARAGLATDSQRPAAEPGGLQDLLGRLVDRDRVHSEATVQADIRQLLLTGHLGLSEQDLDVELETPVGDRRRIDIEVGYTVIEVKRDLRVAGVLAAALQQLTGYVATRHAQKGQRYVGILTDGAEWRAFQLNDGALVESTRFELTGPRPDATALLYWLEGVLATRTAVRPTPSEITARLGATSASHALDKASLVDLYERNADSPTLVLKRQLWADLLRSALGTQFTDDVDLFIEHTLLVNSAEIIAHLVLGLPVTTLQPASLLGGQLFETAGIRGVVEQDFFDWVIEVPGGAAFVLALARRLARFDWARVEHDVLKVLYESVIGAQTRKRLGEYYTPDWLAELVVTEAIPSPLTQRVLDPSCGSGTFLFHAVRHYLAATTAVGVPLAQALKNLTNRVMGVDLHPVAVALARVTYLLAIGRDRLQDPGRGPITVPVYLGDSVQWNQRLDLLTKGKLIVRTPAGRLRDEDNELCFPDHLLADATRFDQLIVDLAGYASKPASSRPKTLPRAVFTRLGIADNDRTAVQGNYELLCMLHDAGQDHIWSYYVRNLARPAWLTMPPNRVDVLVGNPPWLSYRNMPPEMQTTFRQMSQDRGLWQGHEVATHQDLSGLFIARAVQQYLATDGTFGFVVPNAVLDRDYFAGFRRGYYPDAAEPVSVAFAESWDLRRLRPHFFPRGSAVIFGTRKLGVGDCPGAFAVEMPVTTHRWSGQIPRRATNWATVKQHIHREPAQLVRSTTDVPDSGSPYGAKFTQGATLVPRVLLMVEPQDAGPLGLASGRRTVKSSRSNTEKRPWATLDDLDGVVETEFIRPVLLGESILPYRPLAPRQAVLPLEGTDLMDSRHPHLDLYPELATWWHRAEQLWEAHRSSDRLTLRQRIDFRRALTGQLPAAPLRLVYGKAGMHVVAAMIDDPRMIIDHKLYWGTVLTEDEGHYLCAVLNSPALTDAVRPFMSYGKDERDVDKHLWKLPIPIYSGDNPGHRRLAELGRNCAEHIGALELDEDANFVLLRRQIRTALAVIPAAQEINELVEIMLG